MKFIKLFFYFFTLFTFHSIQADEISRAYNQRIDSILNNQVISLKNAKNAQFYGTALFYKQDLKNLYYLTNAHIIGTDPSLWNTFYDGSRLAPLKVIAVAPLYDIAILSINKEHILTKLSKAKPLHDFYFKDTHKSLYGVFGKWNENSGWLIDSFRQWPKPSGFSESELKNQMASLIQENWSNQVTHFTMSPKPEKTFDCPIPGFSECLIFRMPLQGFSGSILHYYTKVDHRLSLGIEGMVSHFTPVSSEFYIIPTEKLIEVAEWILKNNFSGIVQTSMDGKLHWMSNKHIRQMDPNTNKQKDFHLSEDLFIGKNHPGGGGQSLGGGGGQSLGGGGTHFSENYSSTLLRGWHRWFYPQKIKVTHQNQKSSSEYSLNQLLHHLDKVQAVSPELKIGKDYLFRHTGVFNEHHQFTPVVGGKISQISNNTYRLEFHIWKSPLVRNVFDFQVKNSKISKTHKIVKGSISNPHYEGTLPQKTKQAQLSLYSNPLTLEKQVVLYVEPTDDSHAYTISVTLED